MLLTKTGSIKLKHRVVLVLFEAALIVLGVLLGLLANQWRTERAHDETARSALRAIRAELQGNHEQVERLLPYHQQIRDSLYVFSVRVTEGENVVVTPSDMQRALPKGFSVPLLQTTAWELAKQTGAVNHMDFEIATDLARLYGQQAFFQDKLDHIGQNWYVAGNLNPSNFAGTALALNMLSGDIVIQEERLVERYPEMIERLAGADP